MDLGSTNKTFLNVSGSIDILSSFLLIIVLAFVLCMSKLRLSCICKNLDLTFAFLLQDTAIEPQRYYELMEKDTIRFGNSR